MLIVRADAGPKIGAGHVMRCLSVCDCLRQKGENIIFVSANEYTKAIVSDRGYDCVILGTDYCDMDSEVEKLKESSEYKECSAILVDSYYVTKEYFSAIKESKKVVYFDDYMKEYYPVDGIINYNVFADKSIYRGIYKDLDENVLITGPSYAPLRSDFFDCEAIKVKENITDIIVLTGGADPMKIAVNIAKEISFQNISEYTFHFVVGSLSTFADELRSYEESCKSIKVHFNVKDMKSLMSTCDLAISAAGSTLYELCACGVPTINYSIAENQNLGAEGFAKTKAMLTMGVVSDVKEFCRDTLSEVKKLADDFEKRQEMSKAAKKLVDGNGAKRLADELEELFR